MAKKKAKTKASKAKDAKAKTSKARAAKPNTAKPKTAKPKVTKGPVAKAPAAKTPAAAKTSGAPKSAKAPAASKKPATSRGARALTAGKSDPKALDASIEAAAAQEGRGPVPPLPDVSELDLSAFSRQIRLRPLQKGDSEAIIDLQARCFPGMTPWKRAQFLSQLEIFPDGQVCVEYEDVIVASSSSLIVTFSEYSAWHDWQEIADSGFIRNHDPLGDTLYGIELMVHPKYRGMKLARRLYDERKRLAREHNLERIMVGGRIPGYGRYSEELTAREYVEKVIDKTLFDPVLTPQISNGFTLRQLVPDYLPSDRQSLGYATILEWVNLDHSPETAIGSQAARICVVQYEMRRVGSFEDFAAQCEYFVDTASDYRSDFVLFPELITTQLLSIIDARDPAESARRLAEYTPQYLELFGELSVRYNVNIIGGSQFVMEEDKLYNVAFLFRRDGTVAKQYKLHITPAERRWWGVEPGDRMEVFETDRGKIAIQICYDVEFPELSRVAAAKGARLIFVPFNTDERHGYLRVRHCAQARCIENHVYTAIAGCVGNLPFVDNADIHYAQSGIFTPSDFSFSRDAIAAECSANIETVIFHDLDLGLLPKHKAGGATRNWDDRRVDIYRVNYEDDVDRMEI